MKNTRFISTALLTLLAAALCVLAACDTGVSDGTFMDSLPDISNISTPETSHHDNSDPEPEKGQAHIPVIADVINLLPHTVLVTGTCDEGATITIKGGIKDVIVNSINSHFAAEVDLNTNVQTFAMLDATAKTDKLTESDVRTFEARFNATAEKRIDGNGVTVGANSNLLFDYVIDDFKGTNLLSQSEIKTFKTFVENKCNNLTSRADGAPASLIYVLIPDSATIYPERLPQSLKPETFKTRFTYVSEALKQTSAITLDMTEKFKAIKDQKLLYQYTDSHLTEYGAYVVYSELMNKIAERFPDAKPRNLNEFTEKTSVVLGGDLAFYVGANRNIINETVTRYIPKFNLKIGNADNGTGLISDFKKYAADNDARLVSGVDTAAYRTIFKTNRSTLPCALIYRDDNSIPMFDILAERFNNVLMGTSGDFTINMTDAQRYTDGVKKAVDYIIIIVSESNLGKILQ